jgi:hypothetical protein
MTKLPLTGGCQCGGLRYAISEPPIMVYNCHCTNCQKIGGGAFSTPVTVRESSFAFTRASRAPTSGAPTPATDASGGSAASAAVASHTARSRRAGILSVRGGTLDDTSWIEPVGDIWTRSAQPWIARASERIQIDQQPKDYVPFVQRFRAQGRFAD